jgi:hypothetical protein
MTGNCRSERGSITAFVAVVATALVMVAGMAYDGGQVIAAHSRTRGDAARAARAGAQEIDHTTLRATGTVTLDPARAEAAALDYLEQTGTSGVVNIDGPMITVTATVIQPMVILPVPDRRIVVAQTATALDEVDQ